MKNHNGLRAGLSVRLTAAAIVILAVVIIFEGLAWGIYSKREHVRALLRDIGGVGGFGQLHLDSYEMEDPSISGHWRLRPGYSASAETLISEKRNTGKWLGASALQNSVSSDNTVALRVNSNGFKGPELDHAHRCPRILFIGDSVTFGLGAASYPDFSRDAFAKANIGVEVVNGGVEGYSPRNVIHELDRYLALKPEFVAIYIGWNSIFDPESDPVNSSIPLKSVWLFRNAALALEKMKSDATEEKTRSFWRELQPNAKSWVVDDIEHFTPVYFEDISRLIDSFRAIGSQVFLITLMGLFQIDQQPLPAALEIGHLPAYTDNPFVLAALTERHNALLKLETSRDNVQLIDLQGWGKRQLKPLDEYFFDSVHLNVRGLQKVGSYVASEMANLIKAHPKSCSF